MAELEDFPALLKSRLLQGNRIRAYHVSTRPSPHAALFAPALGRSEDATTLESHFLLVSQPHPEQAVSSSLLTEVAVLGIEVLVFATANLTTVFVSKADSTGLLERQTKTAAVRTSPARSIITAFLEFLVNRHRDRRRLVLSLFARSQSQYLFPGSIENATKHVLDDRQLIKWWCRTLDPLARRVGVNGLSSVKAHVLVPGCDSSETQMFFPSSSRADSTSNPLWIGTYPVKFLAETTSLPPRCLVPRLPDDPKSRFLDDLDAQCDENGTWRGIKTLDQFWEMMSYRQECSAGRLVGFVWVTFTPVTISKNAAEAVSDEILRPQRTKQISEHQHSLLSEPAIATIPVLTGAVDGAGAARTSAASSPGSPTIVRGSESSTAGTTMTPANTAVGMSVEDTTVEQERSRLAVDVVRDELQSTHSVNRTSTEARPLGGLALSTEDYQILMDQLLQLDFAGKTVAIDSTQQWCQKAMSLAKAEQFGVDVEGTVVQDEAALATNDAVPAEAAVNIVTGIRKKRKAEQANNVVSDHTEEEARAEPTVSTLAANLVRKKPKA